MPGVQGRVALVTGASKGIGLATAKLLEQHGATVMGVARTQSDLLASGLTHAIAADLSTEEGCRHVVEETLLRLKVDAIDILICNHGIGTAHEIRLDLEDPEAFRRSMRTNLEGPYYLTRFIMPDMVARKYGRCVYTSSTAAMDAEAGGVGYNTSKAALCGLMRSVCQDGGPFNITANAVCPGWVRTELAEQSARVEAGKRGVDVDVVWKERASLYSANRVVTPEEVAHTILFLASEESSGVSGESIRVSLGCPY